MSTVRARWGCLLAVCLLASTVRLPLLQVPLDADEGGYAYLSRQWAAGGRLYGQVWVDRPQGLLLGYRLVTAADTSRAAIHLAAIGCALLLLIGVSSAAWALAGFRAAVIGAVLVAVVGSAPRLQGFMFNGELAAGAFSALAVAAALWWRAVRPRRAGLARWLLVLAGVFAAVAVLMKQSGFDGLLTCLALSYLAGRLRAAALVLLGAAVPFGLAMLHGALTSWHDWSFAIVGYRLQTSAGSRGGVSGRWHNLTAGIPHLWPDLLPLLALGLAGLVWCVLARTWLPAAWLGLALVGFFGGVFFFPHYWMQLVGPLCLLGALALAAIPRRAAVAAVLLCCVPALLWTARAVTDSADQRDRLAVPDPRLLANRDIAPWLTAHAAPGDQVYAFVSSADLYYDTGLHTDFRYLWQANLEAISTAVPDLRRYLAGPDRPQWVVLYQQPDRIDPSGAITGTLAADYRTATVIDGYRVLRAR